MSTRDRILDAAAAVMGELGLARTTTKRIAQAAGYSEATLYKHFRDKEDLFLQVLRERMPQLHDLMAELPARVGGGTVEGNLADVARAALAFYARTVPIAASIFAEPALLARQREALRASGSGPHKPNEAVAAYLAAEQTLGRVDPAADPAAAAALLLGACLQHAFFTPVVGDALTDRPADALATAFARTLTRGLPAGNTRSRSNS